MSEPTIGAMVETSRGRALLLALTPIQARVQPANGDDPYWTLRSGLTVIDQVEEEHEPTVLELLDSAQTCIEFARAQLAQQSAKEVSDAPSV